MYQYPASNFHDLNLDWLLDQMKNCLAEWEETKTEWSNLEADNTEFKAYVTNYLQNLDVSDEISAKIDALIADGTFLDLLTEDTGDGSPLSDTVGAWLAAHITQETGYVVDDTLTVSGAAADAKATGDAISENSITRFVQSDNLLNIENVTVGYQLNGTAGNEYALYANADRVVTPLIPCKLGDVFYVTRIDSNNAFGAINSSSFVSAIAVDKNGLILKRGDWVQGFVADVGIPVYVRFCLTLSVYQNNKIINITKNHYPTSKKGVSNNFIYKVVENDNVNKHVVDMWGDSRIGNGWENYTDISSYLRSLLNTNVIGSPVYGIQYSAPYYVVKNYGVLAQASGMVAARFGSNEIFVNLYGDSIPTSGERQITVLRCTTGNFENFDCWSSEPSKGVSCEIEGVKGTLIRSQSTIKFIRKNDGADITEVRPNSKVIVPNYNSKNHVCVFMCGKNDMGLADGFQVNGVIGNVFGMYSSLNHDYFIVLGETYNCNVDTYGVGTVNRGYVDEINSWYAANIPNNYIDIQAELIEKGLTLQGITPTAADESNIANGFIPDSLMQDEVHPNAQGREAMAKIIYAWMQTKGWI